MIAAGADLKIYIATRPIDFRCGHNGLAAKVQEMLRLDPFSGAAHHRRVQAMVRETAADDLRWFDARRGHPLRA
ncbi:IS66 family insertion sequence element accessory protein TnpB [Bradyrhizobium sp. 38]|nr:IS66 family insertion sequence element accessory protein TnpB [Bradyrhizobium sp. 38]MCK1778168.1 IS66 family insertion sequence element accessory protein TnpB [Bradyrhizobium sp. 132]